MKVKQVRLAQSIPGTASNLLEKDKYDMTFDKGMLTVHLKTNPKKYGDFVVFPANIAWIETEPEATTGASGQTEEKPLTPTGASKKK